MSLAIEVVGKTDVGCVRTNNEDNFGYDTRYGAGLLDAAAATAPPPPPPPPPAPPPGP